MNWGTERRGLCYKDPRGILQMQKQGSVHRSSRGFQQEHVLGSGGLAGHECLAHLQVTRREGLKKAPSPRGRETPPSLPWVSARALVHPLTPKPQTTSLRPPLPSLHTHPRGQVAGSKSHSCPSCRGQLSELPHSCWPGCLPPKLEVPGHVVSSLTSPTWHSSVQTPRMALTRLPHTQ